MDFKSLYYFTVVAQELNITRAAKILNISQPPLSSQIHSLGQYLLIILVAVCVGTVIGLFNGLMISRFHIVPFIVTLITTSIARGIGRL